MTDKKRQQIKAKVAKGQARAAARERSFPERAAEVRDSAIVFAKENPLLVIVGGVALGVAVSMLFSRPRKAAKKSARKASGFAWLAAEMALPFIQQALAGASEAGRAGLDRFEDFSETAGGKARVLGRSAADRAGDTLGAAKDAAKGAGSRIAKAVRSRAH